MVPVITGVVLLGVMVFLVFAQAKALNSAREEKTEQEAALADARQRLQRLEYLAQQRNTLEGYMAEMDRMMPAKAEEDTLIGDLRGYAAQSGLYFREIRFDARENKSGYGEIPFSAAFEGGYSEILDLLTSIQYGPRAVRVDEVKIAQGQRGSHRLRAEIKARAFYRAEGGTGQ